MPFADDAPPTAPWLLLLHRLPPEPAYLRVKVRRRLQKVGAALVKNSVYVLPNTDEALEDFQWVLREITAEGGEAMVCEANFVGGVTNQELREAFAQPRDAEPATPEHEFTGRTWVTRSGVFVDRIASAWLIRRFVDRAATFRFVAPKSYVHRAGELRFDMFEGEFTHEGDRCTFEGLAARFLPHDRAIAAIAEIVHDIDCKDEKFGRPGTKDVHERLSAIRAATKDDEARLARGAVVFDELYARLEGAKA